jgi:hypothetical protein
MISDEEKRRMISIMNARDDATTSFPVPQDTEANPVDLVLSLADVIEALGGSGVSDAVFRHIVMKLVARPTCP